MSRRKKTIIFITVLAAAGILALEILMRLVEPVFPSDHVNDPVLGLRVKPGSLQSNSLGFNDEEFSEAKMPGVFRVAAVGDSFSWTGGIRLNYWTLAERLLNESQQSSRFEILNLGICGTGLREYEAMLRSVGVRFSPDMAAAAVYVGNDLSFDNDTFQIEMRFGTLHWLPTRRFSWFSLERDSYLWSFLKTRFKIWINNQERKKEGRLSGNAHVLSRGNYLRSEKTKLSIFQPSFYDNPPWKQAQSNLLRMRDTSRQHGIPFAVIILPSAVQVDDALWEELFGTFPDLDRTAYDRHLPQKRMIQFLRENEIPFYNVLELFISEAVPGAELYVPSDTHFSTKGNQLTAFGVSRFLAGQIHALNNESTVL